MTRLQSFVVAGYFNQCAVITCVLYYNNTFW